MAAEADSTLATEEGKAATIASAAATFKAFADEGGAASVAQPPVRKARRYAAFGQIASGLLVTAHSYGRSKTLDLLSA